MRESVWSLILVVLALVVIKPYCCTTTPPPVQCTPTNVSDATYLPTQASFSFGEVFTYTCNTGYELTSGNLLQTCKSDGTWNGTLPICSLKTCAAVDVAGGLRTPNQTQYNFNDDVTYSCDIGFIHASGDLVRTCVDSNVWNGTLPVCQLKTCGAVDIPNGTRNPFQAQYNYNDDVTYSCDIGFIHASGDLARTCVDSNVFDGTLPACDRITCLSDNITLATKLPTDSYVDFNTTVTYTCDVGYTITSGDAVRTCDFPGTLSGILPVCSVVTCPSNDVIYGTKTPTSATVVYNTTVTSTCDVGYNLTSGDTTRTCEDSGALSGTPPVCSIITCLSSDVTFCTKAPASTTIDFNTAVTYACDIGYTMTNGDAARTCQITGDLTGTLPVCTIVTCTEPENVTFATKSPIQPSFDYSEVVTYTCDIGFKLDSGDLTRTCMADGTWSGASPVCILVTCAVPSPVSFSTFAPVADPYNYSVIITYTCDTGYEHTGGSLSRTCQANGAFSGSAPVCTIRKCAKILVVGGTASPDQTWYIFNTSVTYTCNLVYNHTSGDLVRTCDATSNWSDTLPVCTLVSCIPLGVTNGQFSPADIRTYIGDAITYTCDLGYYIGSGDENRTCLPDGTWSNTLPTCPLVQCNAPAPVPFATWTPNWLLNNYNTVITYSCNLAYNHTNGNLTRRCMEDFNWSDTAPVCTIAACIQEDSTYMVTTPNQILHQFDNFIIYECILGYNYSSGDLNRTCQNDGIWTGVKPACTIVTCPIQNVPAHASIIPNVPEVNYNTYITYVCDLGYNRTDGDATRRCTEFATFEGVEANCTLVTCDPPAAISDGEYSPMLSEHDYNTTVNFSCNFGYYLLSGNLIQRCDENANWVNPKPVCEIVKCPRPTEPFTSLSPDQSLYNFNTSVTSSCILGYNLTAGDSNRTCLHTAVWDGTPPNCEIITCPTPSIPANASMIPSVPEVNYDTYITYICDLGYNRTDGDATRRCTEFETFEGNEANCTLVTCDPPAAISDGEYSPMLSEYDYNMTVNFSCNTGYYLLSGDLIQRCDENANWVNPKPVCEIVKCPKPTEAYTTVSPDLSLYNFNTSVTSSCVIGYNLTDGDATRTCLHTGAWDGTPPNCTIVECDAPPPVVLSTVVPIWSKYVYLDTLTYTCDIGYEITSGNGVRTCTETSEWTGSAPNCTIIHCPLPPVGVSNTYNPVLLDYIYNDTITHTCDLGYNHSTGDLWRTCQHDKTWSGVTPVCNSPCHLLMSEHVVTVLCRSFVCTSLIKCTLPSNINTARFKRAYIVTGCHSCCRIICFTGAVIQCPRPTDAHMTLSPDLSLYNFNTSVTSSCVIGYNLTDGDATRTCLHTGELDGTPANCTIVECDAPPPALFSTVVPISSRYVYLDTLTYTCDIGYEITSGNGVRTCTETGEWTGSAPNCTIIQCPLPPDGVSNTYNPVLLDYIYNDTITHTCDFGYNHSTGDLWRKCQHDKTWSGVTPVCLIITCGRPADAYMTLSPDLSLYNFNTSVTSSCVIGYNLTVGDATRTCLHTGELDGTPANCTIVECDAPPPVSFSTLVPLSSRYVYLDTLTYTCDIGYEITSGNGTRTCKETGDWTGSAPNCTIIHCPLPPDGVRNTYVPALLDYVYNDTIIHTCDIGYNHSSGDLWRKCQFDKTWSGITPICIIVTCDKIDVQHMTFDPPTIDTHDFNTTIEYSCVIGYNHSYGDLFRTCNYTTEWTGTLPNCTIITCDPPDPIVHSSYVPVQAEHDWNTSISYSCDTDYHHVSGAMETTCNESGTFPPTYTDCSVKHYMAISVTEHAVTWYNATDNMVDTIFDFDGLCDVNITCVPVLDGITHSKTGTQLIMTVTQTPTTVLNEYLCTIHPYEGIRNFPNVSRDVFFGTEILGLHAYVDNPIIYLAVGEPYTFIATSTDGSNVTIEWYMEVNITEVQSYPGAFSTGSLSYTFNLPKHNITVYARNKISSSTVDVFVEVIYRVNGFNLSVADTLGNTTHPVLFDLRLLPSANIPMHEVNISVTFNYGNNDTDSMFIDEFYGVDVSHLYSHLFDMQGNYLVEAKVENQLGFEVFNRTVRIWDSLLPLELDFINAIGGKYLITNTTAHFDFQNVPNFGYKYSIDYGDGFVEANASDTLMYNLYNLPGFMHNYTNPGVYMVHWTAMNGEPSYNRDVKFAVHVQNVVPESGYSLEPLGKKYPWTMVLDMSIELNITLNASVHLPTNATCRFDPDDGNSSVSGLTFDSSFFQNFHDYRTEGLFNATFNCSNDVSYYVYMYDIEIRKFRASDLDIIFHDYVPLNKSDSVVVYFHIDKGDFLGIPKYVYLTWDYGDGNVNVQELYDKPTSTHLYTERGNVTVTVFVEAMASNTTNTLYKSLRLGLMYFDYNTTVQFINYTVAQYEMYGIVGDANYTISFEYSTDEENCSTNGSLSCLFYKLCPQYGYHIIEAVGTNGSFTELDSLNMTCDNPIDFVVDIPVSVVIPNGTIDAALKIPATGHPLPWVTCTWNMGDPVKRKTYGPFSQEATFYNPVIFTFQYIAIGRHLITINCWNLINDTTIERYITVTNDNFMFVGLFDRFYSQEDSPMYISSMLDVEIFGRFQVKAPVEEKTHTTLWQLNITVGETNATRHGLLFTRGLVPEYRYKIILDVCFIEEPDNCIIEPTYAKFVMPPPHAEIVGGARRYVDRGIVTADAHTLSYDPVFPLSPDLEFSWSCEKFNAADFDEASDFLSINNRQSCSFTEVSQGIIALDTDDNPFRPYLAITVTVDNKRGKTATFTQIAAVDTDIEYLVLKCKINCLSKVARSSKLQLVPDLPNNCLATYVWTLKKYTGTTYEDVDISSYTTETGSNSRSLTIKENTLDYGTWYLVTLTATLNGVEYGPAYHEFLTNKPPKGGFCSILPVNETTLFPMGADLVNTTVSTEDYNLTAGMHVFNLTCKDWMDEGFTNDTFSKKEPLFYIFFLRYGDALNDTYRQIVYFDPGQTSNLVSFQAGDVNNNYRGTVVLRITDIFGDYTDVCYNVRSVPPVTNAFISGLSTGDIHLVISNYLEQFDEDLIKANRTLDYRTISRMVMDIASVYNGLALNTSSGIILSPEDLLSLGYVKNEDDKTLRWEDYWKIIVETTDTKTADYIAEVAEYYADMLHASVVTWPPDKRMTLVAIETIGRALNASTAKSDFSNVTAAVLSAECADIMARNLANISDDRTFPNTEQLEWAASGVWHLIRNILAILQTVLTPNFPQNPSVEEMRNYLTYIRIFKTTEEVLNEPLSIQEQTFLSQKQLQKYHLQKYIKSQASKEALPHITQALRNLTYVYGRLSELGQEEMFLENDYVYMSVEIRPAYEMFGQTISRPRVALELNGLTEDVPETCSASTINIRTILFKQNPYFWGQFADRITSYVPLFEIDGATLNSETVTYRLENKVEAECVDKVPTYDEQDPKKMIYILFDRQHAGDDILIFARPNTSDLIYKLYFNKDVKPDVDEKLYSYSTEMIKDGQMWTSGDGYKLIVKSSEYSETGKIWIGLKPILENSGDLSLLTRKFCANVTSVSCLALRQDSISGDYVWDKDLCEVSLSSTRTETICTCQNSADIISVGTTSYIPYNMVDFKTVEESLIYAIGRSPVIAIMVISVCVYVLLVIWAWREDVKDQYKWAYSLMIDNDIADIHFYIVRVFTGLRNGAGTRSKIGFILVGDDCDTNTRIMDDDSHIGFERGSVRTFVMSTRKYLGDILSLRIWHDDTGGNSSSWFLNKVNVTDLTTGRGYTFVCNKWFDFDSGDTRVDRVLHAQPQEIVYSTHDMISYTIAQHHLWCSVFIRPFKSNFTRVQRLSCLLGLIYLTMVTCTLTLKASDEITALNEAVIGPFRFSKENFVTALVAVTISSIVIIIVTFFFVNSDTEFKGPNINSPVLHAYQKVNEKLKLEKSVLGKRFYPPAEMALEYTTYLLPHFFVHVAWALLVASVALATYLLESFTSTWTLIKSEEWMTTMCVSMMCSIIFIETAKVIIILLVYYLFCHRVYEPEDPAIDEDRLEEITRYNSATLTIGPQYGGVLDKPDNPSDEALLANKVKRVQSHQLLKIISQLAIYGALLYMIYTISYESRDPRSFLLKDHVENVFQFKTKVTDLQSFTVWLKTTFINTYFSGTYFGADYDGIEHKLYMADLTNFRIGPARLRQLRIKPGGCLGPLGKGLTCHNKYTEKKKEASDYCLGWQSYPCLESERSSYFTSPAWKYTSAKEVWGFPTVAEYSTYGGGGYFMKLDVNRDVCDIIFDELLEFSWFDEQTRAVILEFTLYNANTNLFVYSKFVAEFPEVGGFLPYMDIQVFRLYLNTGPDGDFMLFLQFFFLLIVIAATFVCVYEMVTDCRAFFKSVWNYLDMAALAMGYITISIFIYKMVIIDKTIEMFNNDKNAYVGFENLAFYDFVTNTAYGILVFLLSVRVSRILGYSGKINEMAAVISASASDLSGFLLIFGITYFAYVIWGTLLFGKEQDKYKDVFQTYGTLTEAIIGKNRVSYILNAKPGFAEFYYFTFVLFVLMTLATLAAAILNFSIAEVRKEQKILAPTNIVEVIIDRIVKLVKKISSSKGKKTDDNKQERRGSDSELNDILLDLRNFTQTFKSKWNKKKASDKYKLTGGDEPN